MFPTLIEVFGVRISTYGVLVALGLITAYFLSLRLARREGIPEDKAESVFIYAALFGLVGSRIAFILEHPEDVKGLLDIFAIWKGGVSFYGGLAGGIIGVLVAVKKHSLDLWKVADVAAPSLALAHSIGRLGCTSAGCCYGSPVPDAEDVSVGIHFMKDFPFFYVVFPPGAVAPYGIPLYPTQILEAVGNFIIFLVLLFLFRRKAFNGEVFVVYMLLYGAERFALEFYRGVTPPIEGLGLTWNQIASLLMVILAVVLFFLLRRLPSPAGER
ncbi:MAG: prolipoprotein diacylglyceryl transferase [Aquificota bacterium]|nr:prolipoprotein diacylglyceryl transferase [Aquificota bacterium]